MPTAGTGRTFNEANIRYCQFQKARLQFIEPRISSDFAIDAFNTLVNDFNSRCSNFRYRQGDLSNVQSELAQKQAELQAQAQRIMNGWEAHR
jgi:hypothetical protein